MLRPHLYNRYFSEEKATRRLVLEAVPSSYVARRFVLRAVSAYIHDKSGAGADIRWFQTVVVESEEIFRASNALQDNACPLIIQVGAACSPVLRADARYRCSPVFGRTTRPRYI